MISYIYFIVRRAIIQLNGKSQRIDMERSETMEENVNENVKENEKEKEAKKPRQKIHEFDLSQDIRYRGPLSYRYFKIFGWICLALSQLVILFRLISNIAPPEMLPSTASLTAMAFFGSLAIPFLLIGNFARILNNRYEYKRQIMVNGIASLAIIALFLFIFFHYILGFSALFSIPRIEFAATLRHFVSSTFRGGVFAFNIFIDLFLCTMFMFFLTYEPKRFFTGKRHLAFRLLAILPILYEATSIVLKILANYQILEIPPVMFPFLTTKPPMMFLVFVILALYVKIREHAFLKNGRTMEEYRQFLHTKKNSWNVSVFAAILFLAAGVLDFIIFSLLIGLRLSNAVAFANAHTASAAAQGLLRLGIGSSIALIPLAPVMLLFSYNRTHKNSTIDVMIPIGGVALIVLVYMEFIYQVILQIPVMFGG